MPAVIPFAPEVMQAAGRVRTAFRDGEYAGQRGQAGVNAAWDACPDAIHEDVIDALDWLESQFGEV